MTLPYTWRPLGVDPIRRTTSLKPGELVAFDHAVWRVIEVHPKPEDEDKPWRVRFRPAHINTGDVRDRDHDKAYKVVERTYFNVYPDEHYPICAKCLEPLPCREQMAEATAAVAAREFERYSAEAVCPACTELVSPRQQSRTFSENLVVPGGPPVTFHLRRQCWSGAMEYEKRWVAAEPNRRRVTMSCTGHVINHHDGTSGCTEPGCPRGLGELRVWHGFVSNHYPGYSDCWCVTGTLPDKPAEPETPDHSAELRGLLDGDA